MSIEKKRAIKIAINSILLAAISIYAFVKVYPQNYCPSPKLRFGIIVTLVFFSLFELLYKKEEDAGFNIYMAMGAISAIVTAVSIDLVYKVVLSAPFTIYVLMDLYLDGYRIKTKTFMKREPQSFEDVYIHVHKIRNAVFTKGLVQEINFKTNRTMENMSEKRTVTIYYTYGNSKSKCKLLLGLVPNAIQGINKKDLLYAAVDVDENPNLVIDSIHLSEDNSRVEINYVVRKYKNISSFSKIVIKFADYVGIFSDVVSYDNENKQLYRKYNLKFDL